MTAAEAAIVNGMSCRVVKGTHAGKSGIVEDRKLSKTGHATITVRQADGVRFKTLARNVELVDRLNAPQRVHCR